ncbi:MAG TPA: hypothetical protein VN723_05760 [Rhizomicrobium sp.]|nr:hypothetical protein [Rhizomicrobium sp.]
MADMPAWLGVKLAGTDHAIHIGFTEAVHLRKKGALPEHLNEQRELLEKGYPDDRGPRNIHYAAWRLGFDAGYRGEKKPAADQV